MDRIVGGEQRYRAVQLLFDQGSVFYGTDAPNSPNYICRLDRRSGVVERVQTVEGPVFYGCIAGDCMYFSTVCEPTDIGRNREAGVWQRGLHDSNWVRVLSFQKDIWPMRLCQYGQVVFPAGSMSNALLWLSPMATEHDQNSLAFRFADLRRKSIDC
ncbi:MAG TPA: hypothetical protein VE046_07225 [Steroidobacteraceae bacterium]|nr:hypothetical protein [Steroidobacteraceae bacterium]